MIKHIKDKDGIILKNPFISCVECTKYPCLDMKLFKCDFAKYGCVDYNKKEDYEKLQNKYIINNMETVIGEALKAAYDVKNNDSKSFVWKGPKKEVSGHRVQEEVRLIDATPEQLKNFYEHCYSMLYSKDKINPGRFTLKDIVNDQISKCNTELFLRYMENKYLPETTRAKYPRYLLFKDIKSSLDKNIEALPKEQWKTTSICGVLSGVPEEFRDVYIENVLDGCLDRLGIFDKKHLSLNFLTKLGVWFTASELKDLTIKDEETGKNKDRLEVIKERLRLSSNVVIRVNNKGLSYTELRAMLTLRSKKYSDLTTDQLLTLRNKVLFRFEDEIDYHISQWEERIRQLKIVAAEKKINLEETK